MAKWLTGKLQTFESIGAALKQQTAVPSHTEDWNSAIESLCSLVGQMSEIHPSAESHLVDILQKDLAQTLGRMKASHAEPIDILLPAQRMVRDSMIHDMYMERIII